MCLAQVGKSAPDFSMPIACFGEAPGKRRMTLNEFSGRWLILFFYPLDFTDVCPTELISMSDRIEEFSELGAEVLGVSVDSVHAHAAWMSTPRLQGGVGPLKYPLASDMTRSVSSNYGILSDEACVALRGLFIVDPEGVLQYAAVTNLNVGRSTDETLRVLQALQTGGLCPADWKPGSAMVGM
ncbi:MAG: peroxiredoxin [Armatimonadetes bacterium]|nr:peroxiredoxin [Armatimonadota bacterium]MDE2205174.1 peroxiredoxin [Armatimonadota bacterium]